MSDQQELSSLLVRLAEGDRSAFSRLFDLLWPRIHGVCLSLLSHPQDADDAAQSAMEKILTRASEYDRTRPAAPWALGVAAWECRTLRARARRRREVPDDDLPQLRAEALAEDELIRRELETAAVAVLQDLPPNDRAALVAAFWEEAQSAASPAARKQRQRALERLRAAFRRLYDA